MKIDNSQNIGIGTSTFDGSAAGVLAVANGTAPAAGTAGQCYIYAHDVTASSELHVMDVAGNESPISPHMDAATLLSEYGITANPDDPMPRIEMTTNRFIGVIQISYTDPITNVTTTVHKYLEDNEVVDWDGTQAARESEVATKRAQWQAEKDQHDTDKAARDAKISAWDISKAADPEFAGPRPEAMGEFEDTQPPAYTAKPVPNYVTRGKAIRDRLKPR